MLMTLPNFSKVLYFNESPWQIENKRSLAANAGPTSAYIYTRRVFFEISVQVKAVIFLQQKGISDLYGILYLSPIETSMFTVN